MPLVYSIDRTQNRVVMEGTGPITMAAFDAIRAELMADPDFRTDCDQLLDLTSGGLESLSSNDIRTLVRKTPFTEGARRAIVVTSALGVGLARMFQILADDSRGTIRVFTSREEAEVWLARAEQAAGTEGGA